MDKINYVTVKAFTFTSFPLLLLYLGEDNATVFAKILFILSLAQTFDAGVFLHLQSVEPAKRRVTLSQLFCVFLSSLIVYLLTKTLIASFDFILILALILISQILNIYTFFLYSSGRIKKFVLVSVIGQLLRMFMVVELVLSFPEPPSVNVMSIGLVLCLFVLLYMKLADRYAFLNASVAAVYIYLERFLSFGNDQEGLATFLLSTSILSGVNSVQSAFLHREFKIGFFKSLTLSFFLWIPFVVGTYVYLKCSGIHIHSLAFVSACFISFLNLLSSAASYKLANLRMTRQIFYSTLGSVVACVLFYVSFDKSSYVGVILVILNFTFLHYFIIDGRKAI